MQKREERGERRRNMSEKDRSSDLIPTPTITGQR